MHRAAELHDGRNDVDLLFHILAPHRLRAEDAPLLIVQKLHGDRRAARVIARVREREGIDLAVCGAVAFELFFVLPDARADRPEGTHDARTEHPLSVRFAAAQKVLSDAPPLAVGRACKRHQRFLPVCAEDADGIPRREDIGV